MLGNINLLQVDSHLVFLVHQKPKTKMINCYLFMSKWNCESLSHVWLLVIHGVWPTRLLCPWDSPGRNTEVGCHSLLQGIFPTQSPALQADSFPSEPPGDPHPAFCGGHGAQELTDRHRRGCLRLVEDKINTHRIHLLPGLFWAAWSNGLFMQWESQ